MNKDNLLESVQYLKGVGPTKAKQLENLGIYTVYDLITHFPREYEDRNNLKKIDKFVIGENVVFIAEISTRPEIRRKGRGFSLTYFYVSDETGRIRVSIFNQSYLNDKLEIGKKYAFYGKVEEGKLGYEIVNPLITEVEKMHTLMGYYPIYPLTHGLKNGILAKIIYETLSKKYALPEIFTDEFRKRYNLCEINYAINNIHRPESMTAIDVSRRRLIFEELFLLQLALLSIRNRNFETRCGISFKDVDYSKFLEVLPFELTNAQKNVVEEIACDMSSVKPMNRLVQGDVGSGKTIVAAIAMYIAVKNGYQACLMAPTTILAKQHYEELKKYFEKFNMTVGLLTGATTPKNKKEILEKLKLGKIDILIGTTAMVSDNVEFKKCGLVITDEQHRFGVKQRMTLNAKGDNADVLVMTATPIPRTLALMVYSDLDMSIIDELPKGRIPIKTYVVNETLEDRINNFVRKEIEKGRQAYVVCPLIEENEELDLTDATNLYERYKNEIFKDIEVGFLNGKMKKKEKEKIMEDFKFGKTKIIVSTTVIEVGVNVPNATLMIIENADRFGLATLHQLRGRVGRSTYESFCVLKTKNMSKECRERLGIMVKSNNGFEIAEKDLDIRGPGDFFGVRQHGLPEFKLANLLKDTKLLKITNDAAKELLEMDKTLDMPEHKTLKEELYKKYKDQLTNIGT